MNTSVSSEEGVSSPLLGKSPSVLPSSIRSSKSVVNQVKDTIFSFLKKAKVVKEDNELKDDETTEKNEENIPDIPLRFSPEVAHSRSQRQRTKEAFLERITSFTIPNWMGKPLSLSPPLLAQYGWQCFGQDTVKCVSCSAILSVRLPWPDAGNYRLKCFEYRRDILATHTKICTWPSNPCPDSFVTSFAHWSSESDNLKQGFSERRQNLTKLQNNLPQLQKEILDEMNLSEKDLKKVLSIPEEIIDTREAIVIGDKLSQDATVIVLAMCGWDTNSTVNSNAPSVTCKLSGRTIGLWNFFPYDQGPPSSEIPDSGEKSGEKRPASDSEDAELLWSTKRLKTNRSLPSSPSHLKIKKSWFHPLQQHHPWSPWITVLKPISQNEFGDENVPFKTVDPILEGRKPGWEILRDIIIGRPIIEGTISSKEPTAQDCGEETQGLEESIPKQVVGDSSPLKTPPRLAVKHVRKLLNEWASPN